MNIVVESQCAQLYKLYAVPTSTQLSAHARPSVLSWRCYSVSPVRSGLLHRANERFERSLQRHFPGLSVLYLTFKNGFRLLLQDVREMRRIRMKMLGEGVALRQLPYREMEAVLTFRKDVIKAIPLLLISLAPFAIVVVFTLMYLFPRQLLIGQLWTAEQQRAFRRLDHQHRLLHRMDILQGVARAGPRLPHWGLRTHLLTLCSKVQSGVHPSVKDITSVRDAFSGPPLGLKTMDTAHMRLLCSQLFLTPWLPGFLLRRRLSARALDLLYLDRALQRLGTAQLSSTELHQACFLRGLDSSDLSAAQSLAWLQQWIQLSCPLSESQTSLLLHNMVLLSLNYPAR